MCSTPDVPEPIRYQEMKAPTYRDGASRTRSTGRRSTILTGGQGTQQGMSGASVNTPTSKTLLGA